MLPDVIGDLKKRIELEYFQVNECKLTITSDVMLNEIFHVPDAYVETTLFLLMIVQRVGEILTEDQSVKVIGEET